MNLIRLDDASEYIDVEKWNAIEVLFDKYDIKPIVGVIPNNQDQDIVRKYPRDLNFWGKVKAWEAKGWTIALHGYSHVFSSEAGGINPVNFISEFAGLPLDEQKAKIRGGVQIFREHQLNPKLFCAPAHTFDQNTLKALTTESDIRIISDSVANDIYSMDGFYFIPLQSGHVQSLPFKLTTFCYHPNNMNEKDYQSLESFLKKYKEQFISFADLTFKARKLGLYDKVLRRMYFTFRNARSLYSKYRQR